MRNHIPYAIPLLSNDRKWYSIVVSIALLLMPWWCKEPGDQQLWHWLCKINHCLSSKSNNYYQHLNVKQWQQMLTNFNASWNHFSTLRVNIMCYLAGIVILLSSALLSQQSIIAACRCCRSDSTDWQRLGQQLRAWIHHNTICKSFAESTRFPHDIP